MKFIISRNLLNHALNKVSRAVSPKMPIPILSGIKFEVNEKEIILTASDGDITIQTVVRGNEELLRVDNTGIVILSSRYITDIIRKIEDEFVSIEIMDGLLVKIKSSRSEFKLNSYNPNDYPTIDLTKKGNLVSIESEKLNKIVNQTAFAVSQSEARPFLTGVNFKASKNKLECVGTDSYRLAKKIIEIEEDIFFNINIPARALVDITKIIEKENMVNLYISDKRILFELENSVIQSRLIDGAYPDTSNLIPKSFLRELELDLRELSSAIDRVSLLSPEMNNIIKIEINDEQDIKLSSKSQEIGSVEEQLNVIEYKGEELEISFSAKYLSDAIKCLETDKVRLCFLGDMEPFIIKDIGDNSVIQLILPVRTY